MAYSFVYHVGDGVTTNFSVPFSFLNRSHVYLKIDGVASTGFSWVNDGAIAITPAPADGASVLIYRDTPKNARLVDFSNESHLSAANLDLSAEQIFYINQEEFDWARRGMDFIDDAQAAAESAEEHAGYAVEAANRAETLEANAELFMTRAETASNLAEVAKGLAIDAKDGAVVAKEQAVTAKDAALAAKTSAETAASQTSGYKDTTVAARDTAVAARDTAVAAKTAAETAQSGAVTAKNGADSAKVLAESARDAAISAKTLAETAKTGADSAATAANAAKTDAQAARDKSQKWAEENKGVEVETGEYSAKHWAQTASDTLSSKAPINSPIFTGTPTAPTAAQGTNTNQIATTAHVFLAMMEGDWA